MDDFLFRFFTAESKREYFFKNWGWADLLASTPVQQFKLFRIFRIIKVGRMLREFGLRNMLYEIRDNCLQMKNQYPDIWGNYLAGGGNCA